MGELEKLKAAMRAKKKPQHLPYDKGLSSGSTLINLACSGTPDVAFLPGYYYAWVGDSGSGKTFITLTTLAEAASNPHYKDYRLIFDQPERGALMDFEKFFGKKMAERIEPPWGTKKQPAYSTTLDDFYYTVARNLDKGPCIYILDSMDALSASDDVDKFDKRKDGKKATGSYGTAKAKQNSSDLRVVHNRLAENGSILIIICQTRQNIGFDATFNPKTRGGGLSLTFYAALELWTSIRGHIKKTVRERPIEQGVTVKIRVKKGRLAGKDRTVEIPIYHSGEQPGIDDLGSCVNWLVEWKHWKESQGKISAPEFSFSGSHEKLVALIEEGDKEKELRQLTARIWQEIESACEVKRKKRYS